jgi:hypothetical protein
VLNNVVLNQVLVRFACDGGNVTDEVIDNAQREGTCWMSGTKWEGEPAMRISVCNWRTTEDDILRSAKAILAQADIAARASAQHATRHIGGCFGSATSACATHRGNMR